MMGRMSRQPLMQFRVVVFTALFLGALGNSAASDSQSSPHGPVETMDSSTSTDEPAHAFLEAINELRSREQSPPLRPSEPLSRAARILLDRALLGSTTQSFDPEARLTREDLRDSGYEPNQFADGLASSTGDPADLVGFWRQTDPESLDAFLGASLRDFGLATETLASQTIYALVAATSQSEMNRPILEQLSQLELVRQDLLERINVERKLRHRPPLRLDRALNSAAQLYADRMMQEGFYGHVSPRGDTVLDRVRASGYEPELTGENLASGPQTTAQAMEGWMASNGHRENILDPGFRDVGFGVSVRESNGDLTILWVQCFGRP